MDIKYLLVSRDLFESLLKHDAYNPEGFIAAVKMAVNNAEELFGQKIQQDLSIEIDRKYKRTQTKRIYDFSFDNLSLEECRDALKRCQNNIEMVVLAFHQLTINKGGSGFKRKQISQYLAYLTESRERNFGPRVSELARRNLIEAYTGDMNQEQLSRRENLWQITTAGLEEARKIMAR